MRRRQINLHSSFLALLFFVVFVELGQCFSIEKRSLLSRKDALLIGIGAAASYSYVKQIEQAFDRIDYPPEHENRVRSVLRTTLAAALENHSSTKVEGPVRILEVGIGTAARLLRRGLYEFPLDVPIELVGLDIRLPTDPKILEDIHLPDNVLFRTLQASITDTKALPEEGSFDAVICCFTLCSVEDPMGAVTSIHRVLRSTGGVFGFVEHVAAPESNGLARQQVLLDPLQNLVAQNCHLHRSTSNTIKEVFGDASRTLQYEEVQVDSMWPVSYQSYGVTQRLS